MKLTDVIALAKAGYKKADIDELLTVQVDEPDDDKAAPASTEAEPAPEGGAEISPETSSNVPDYEALYNEVMKDLEKTRNDLKVAQDQNRHANNSGSGNEPDPWKDLEEIARGYM